MWKPNVTFKVYAGTRAARRMFERHVNRPAEGPLTMEVMRSVDTNTATETRFK